MRTNPFLSRSVGFLLKNANLVEQYRPIIYEIEFTAKAHSFVEYIETDYAEIPAENDLFSNDDGFRQLVLKYIIERKKSDYVISTTLMTFHIYKREAIMVERGGKGEPFRMYFPNWKNPLTATLATDKNADQILKEHKEFLDRYNFATHYFEYLSVKKPKLDKK